MRIWHLQACGCGLIVTVLTMAPVARAPSEARLGSSQTETVLGNVVDITAGDFFFTAPESIPGGLTTFRLRQVGKVAHDMSIVQLTQNKTFEEFAALVKARELLTRGTWAKHLGGPGFIEVPRSTNATLVLEPGTYALACFMVFAGDPPEHQQMLKPLHVVPAPGAPSMEPPTDLVVKILDDGHEFSPSLSAGRHLLRVENAASQSRLFRMERLLPGRTIEEARKWGPRSGTERPTISKGRLASMEPGRHLIMAVDLDPGTYLVGSLPARATGQEFVVR